jgi:hypothetical protein
MKRKSILMTIVTVLFAATAWGQQLSSWPTTSVGQNGVVSADTIFFCNTADSLYPIEFGYDVAGKKLSPNYGEWSLIATFGGATPMLHGVPASDYDFNTKNGGAGNAYKLVGSGKGIYLFQYLSKDVQCGLQVDEKYWIYIFVLPNMSNTVTKPSDTYCKENITTPREVSFDSIFGADTALFNKAKITYRWKSGNKKPFYLPGTVDVYSLHDTLLIDPHKGYNCGLEGRFSYTVEVVDSLGLLTSKIAGVCASDLAGSNAKRNPNVFFKRGKILGKEVVYNPSEIGLLTDFGSAKKRAYNFTYTDCNGKSHTVFDTLFLSTFQGDWGVDTSIVCRTASASSVFDHYNNLNYMSKRPNAKPPLDYSNSKWVELGLTVNGPTTGIYQGGATASLDNTGYTINNDALRSNMGYYYKWTAVGIDCYINPSTGESDFGAMVVILRDKSYGQDYTTRLCLSSYTAVKKNFSLAKYTGLHGVKWTDKQGGTNGLTPSGDSIDISKLKEDNTYTFRYTLSGGCGAGGSGLLLIQTPKTLRLPAAKTVRYCVHKLPPMINLNDVLGVSVESLTWTLVSVDGTPQTSIAGFTSDGILDIGLYSGGGNGTAKLQFKATPTSSSTSCTVGATDLTIDIVTTL